MKRIISLLLTLLLLVNVVVFSASATQLDATENTETEVSAEIVDNVMFDTEIVDDFYETEEDAVEVENETESYEYDAKEAPAQTGAARELHFDTTSAGWKNFKQVFCHIYSYNGYSIFPWMSSSELCHDSNVDGIWTYDLNAKNVTLKSGTMYCVVFKNENGLQTHPLLFDSSVLGDTAYCNGTVYENPLAVNKTTMAAYWKNQNVNKFGPELCITLSGNVVGTCLPSTTNKRLLFIDFINTSLQSARNYSGKSDQKLIDDIGAGLGLTSDDIADALCFVEEDVGRINWWISSSSLPSYDWDGDGVGDREEVTPKYTPELIDLSITSNGIRLDWERPTSVDGYYIYRKTASSDWKRIKTITNRSSSTYTDNTMTSCATYYYALKGYYGSSKKTSKLSNTMDIIYVPKPSLSSVSSTSSGLKVSWKKMSGASGYEVYRKGSNEDTYTKIATVKGAVNTSYHDKKVKNGITYRYAIKAYKSSQKSAFSSTKAFDPKAKSELRLAKKGTRTLSLSAIKSKKYYYSSNKSIFTVNSKGKITAKAGGKATLTVKAKGVCVKTTILVSSPKIALSASKTKIYRGYSTTIKAVSYPDNVKMSWKTSNSKVATVNSSGKVTGKGKGTATITASIKYNGKTYKKSVKITVVCQKPSFNTLMTTAQSYSPYVAIQIVNTGKKTLRINKTGGKCMGNSMILCAVRDDKIVDLKYVDIKPGGQYVAIFRTKSNKSILYTRDTSITFCFSYDGLEYSVKTSSKYNYLW